MPAISQSQGPVAVTGCSGFTGGHMVREMALHGYQVRACIRDANSWRGKDAVDYLSSLPNVEVIDGCDLFIEGSYDDAFDGCSAVFQVAAVLGNSADGKSQPLGSGDVPTDIYDGGLKGTQNVIDSINRTNSVRRLVYTSSMAAVAGRRAMTVTPGYEWTEEDWASDGVEEQRWQHPANSYARSKVETEQLISQAGVASGGRWDAVTMCPAMICGPVLFKAQVGQWIEQIGRMANNEGPNWPSPFDMYYNIIDVRDLVKAHRLAAEIDIDHSATKGGARYLMHGSGGRSTLLFSEEVRGIIHDYFPAFELGLPQPVPNREGDQDSDGKPPAPHAVNDCKKAKEVLGATIRPIDDTIRAVVETSIELGVIEPKLAA
ncbi:MAG: NAD-dependent epimerase/dehydratase family protein [Gammaproteobacteria bacterium]|nr:NAD-dependent epimerase/dehydratase family protein [Gammaproteobacteria bacterium]